MEHNSPQLNPENWAETYGDYLYNYAAVRVNNHEVALDLVQDAFVAALKSAQAFEGRSSEKTWLVSILKRKIIDYYRKASRKREQKIIDKDFSSASSSMPFQADGDMAGHWLESRVPQDWQSAADKAVENEELGAIIEECIGKLPPKWSSVFAMRVIDEYETEEVCKELGISSSNLWVILHRARHQLRDCVESKWTV